jgi:hypothetical protein
MRTAPARNPGNVVLEQKDGAGIGGQLTGNQIEQCGLAGTVRPDDQSPLAGLHR